MTCGSVDDGKSTLIGRLLYDTKLILEDHMATLESDSRKFGTTGDELDLALSIINQRVNEKFEPERYEDEVRATMMERIQQKIDGQAISMPPEEAAE